MQQTMIINFFFLRWQYDHKAFPGVVPRTFIGPLVVGLASVPLKIISNVFKYNKDVTQYIGMDILKTCD